MEVIKKEAAATNETVEKTEVKAKRTVDWKGLAKMAGCFIAGAVSLAGISMLCAGNDDSEKPTSDSAAE